MPYPSALTSSSYQIIQGHQNTRRIVTEIRTERHAGKIMAALKQARRTRDALAGRTHADGAARRQTFIP
jgi:hypothetical protein